MLKKPKILSLFFIVTLLFSQSCYNSNIIFDLNGVLIKQNINYFISKINIIALITYLVKLNNPFLLKERFYDILRNIPTETTNTFDASDDNEKKIPNIMCDWLSGKKTSTEIKFLTLKFLEDQKNFCKPGEKGVFCNLIDLIFNPEDYVKSTVISQESINFVKKCKEKGHKLFILSNWDVQSISLLTKKHSELFDLFDQNNIVFSGQIGLIKPDPEIYKYIINKNNLDPKECIFFDDQEINVKNANEVGIHAVLCKNAKCTDMEKELEKFTKQVTTKSLYPKNYKNPDNLAFEPTNNSTN